MKVKLAAAALVAALLLGCTAQVTTTPQQQQAEQTATTAPATAVQETAQPVETALPYPRFRSVPVHDPSVMRTADGTYYIYGSHMAAAKSTDLIQWELISRDAGRGCTLVENVQQQMQEALSWAQTNTFWAPCVIELQDGRYYMYYCTCRGDSPLSALGLAVADSPEGPFENKGIFLKSGMEGYDATYYPNVVDPHAFFDKEGRLWMVYGSYSGGIFILEMDQQTGFPLEGQEPYGKKLLGKNHSRIEAPYMVYSPETDYYYLFLSFGGLEAGDGYNIRVCRSKNPDGPFEDAKGQDMINCGGSDGSYFNDPDYAGYGTKVMGSYVFHEANDGWEGDTLLSPGHNSVYYDEQTGDYFLIFHTRFGHKWGYEVYVHRLFINEDGWFVCSPTRYAGETVQPVAAADRAGAYRLLCHELDINGQPHESVYAALEADGTVTGGYSGTWTAAEDGRFTITLGEDTYTGVMNLGYDESQGEWVTVFTAMDKDGISLWGIRDHQ
ncbi:MAG: glycoside hydrolase family 43 protein [Clostridia bacterium]|nr:glycoside hydrolase family 43 protein [Clostridia bacterium]